MNVKDYSVFAAVGSFNKSVTLYNLFRWAKKNIQMRIHTYEYVHHFTVSCLCTGTQHTCNFFFNDHQFCWLIHLRSQCRRRTATRRYEQSRP